jgi:hypothetical protein
MKKLAYGLFIVFFAVMFCGQNVMAGPGKVRLEAAPAKLKVNAGEPFSFTIVANSPVNLAAMDFALNYDNEKVVITDIRAGRDGSVAASNVQEKGVAKVNGFEVNGMGQGKLELLVVEGFALERQTRNKVDDVTITIIPKHLTDEFGKEVKRTTKVKAKLRIVN